MLPEPLRDLAEDWLRAVRTPRRRAAAALVALAIVVALLVAREGTTRARVGATVALVSIGLVLALYAAIERRVWRDPARAIRRLAGRADPKRAATALRALSLLGSDGDTRDHGTSAELARLHIARSLASLPAERIVASAARLGRVVGFVAIGVGACAFVVGVVRAWSVLEGADVLVARHGIAPVPMQWLDDVDLRARPPEYLHQEERPYAPSTTMALPRGTLLTFRGEPAHPGRRVLLTDGESEVPFVDDGSGRLVARWPLVDTVKLRVVARFGGVVIPESEITEVTSIPDAPPLVVLEGAPRTIRLAGDSAATPPVEADDGDIPIRYEATDDHGLREVHLVLRSGTREERRVLARLDGETRYDRGGHVLRARDPFLKKSHAPVEVRVEAKDNDPLTGPKWGASEAITIVPPDVGEPEANRLDALRKLRDALVDSLATRIAREVPNDGQAAARRAFLADERRGMEDDSERLEVTLTATYAGVRVPSKLAAMLRGQMRKVRDAIEAESKRLASGTHVAVIGASERFALVADAVIHGLGMRDARDSAKQLADVADDLAHGASQRARPDAAEKDRGVVRMLASTHVLKGGAGAMKRFGALGRDLGGIVDGDLSRVARATNAGDMFHAELAARDLAARLRQPDPSFGGAQGRAGRGGGESGGARGTPGDEGQEPDEAQRAFNEAAGDLERLAQDHAGEMAKVEQALNGAESEEERKALMDEAKKHADAIRDATKGLPSVGGGSDSWTSKGAAAKEHAEQMAKSLEGGNPADAVSSGRSALQALEEAKRIAARERWSRAGDPDAERKIDDTKKKLEGEVRWAEQQLEAMRRRAAERARKQLEQQGDEEDKIADRAKKLGEKGRDKAGLPQPALEALDDAERAAREAAEALKRGDAERALDRQREAQRKLEMAKQQLGESDGDDNNKGGDDDGPPSRDHAEIPKADAHKGPEEFRKRVIKGLGQPAGGKMRDAVRRYAEGLLR